MNIYIKLVGVHWAGFPYPWPTYPCSPSYSMICLVIGDSHSSPITTTLSTELSVLKSPGSPWFLVCRCSSSYNICTLGIFHLLKDFPWLHYFTSCPFSKRTFLLLPASISHSLLSSSETRPTMPPTTVSKVLLIQSSKTAVAENASSQKSFWNISVTPWL